MSSEQKIVATEITGKMASECTNCHENAVEVESGGQLICHNCGLVVEGRVFNFEIAAKGSTWMTANGTAKFEGRYEVPNATKRRLPSSSASFTEKQFHRCLQTMVRQLNLPQQIHEKTRELLFGKLIPLRKGKQLDAAFSRHRSVVVGACLFIVSRQNNIQLTYRRMAEFAECNMFLLGKAVKVLVKSLDIKLEPLTVESLIPCILSELTVMDSSCEKLCINLCQILGGVDLARNAAARAASLVLLTLESKGIVPDKESVAEVLGKNSVTKTALQDEMRVERENLLELAKEVPWIPDSVKKKDIAKHIDTIVNFHNQCAQPETTVVKSPWMKKKEVIERLRKAKIQMAKLRILSKEFGDSESSTSSSYSSQEHRENSCHKNDKGGDGKVASQSCASQKMGTLSCNDELSSAATSCNKCAKNSLETANGGKFKTCDCGMVVLIEELLQSGYSEDELMDGYFESRISDLHSSKQLDPEGEREDLDEMDIADQEMHQYLWTVAEMERLKNIKEEDVED